MRTAAQIAAIALAAVAAAVAGLTTRLDRGPILGTDDATATLAAIEAAGPAARSAGDRGPLRAGFARRAITPPLGTPTLGYGARRGEGTRAVADELHARALALAAGSGPPVVVLSADLCLWTSTLSERVARAVADRVPRERLYFGATHTHNGPGAFVQAPAVEWSMGGYDPDVARLLVERSVEAIGAALAGMEPADHRAHRLDGSPWVENRSHVGVPLDDSIEVLEWRQRDGDRVALVVFAAHATAIDASHVVSSGDWPGALLRDLAERGVDALLLAGPTGQAGPRHGGGTAHAPDTETAVALGREIAAAVAGALRAPAPAWHEEAALAVLRAPVALPAWRVRLPGLGVGPFEPALRPWLARRLLGQSPIAHVHALRIGGSVLVGHSFEFGAVPARRLEARARERGVRLAITSFNGDHGFYVVPEADYDRPVYESGMTFFGPGLAPYLGRVTEAAWSALVPAAGYGAVDADGGSSVRPARVTRTATSSVWRPPPKRTPHSERTPP